MATVAEGWFILDGKDRAHVKLSDRGKLTITGDGPGDWLDLVLRDYGGYLVTTANDQESLLPVRSRTFADFMNKVASLAWRNTGVDWRWRLKREAAPPPDAGQRGPGPAATGQRTDWT